MKELPIVIAVVIAVVIVRLRRRRNGDRPWSLGQVLGGFHGWNLLGDTGLVAGREIRERVRGRVFRVVTAVLFAGVGAAVVIPTLRGGDRIADRIGAVGTPPSSVVQLQALARGSGLSVSIVAKADLRSARAALATGRLDMVVDGSASLLVADQPSGSSAWDRFVQGAAVTLGADRAFAQAGLTPQQAAAVARARPLAVHSLHPAKAARSASESTALLSVILIFVVLTQYLTWTLMGVMEEKANRVVEVLLATVRPLQLLAGKVLGIGTVALAQAVALAAFALVLADAVGSGLVHGAAPTVLGASLVWLVLGYAFYSWVYAAAGSLAERQDQVQSLALPLSAPLIFGYIVSLVGVSSGRPSLLVRVLAYLPPTAPFAMPALVGFGQVTWWQFLLAIAISGASTLLVAVLASRVYRTAVLRTGGRVRLRDLRAALMQRAPSPGPP